MLEGKSLKEEYKMAYDVCKIIMENGNEYNVISSSEIDDGNSEVIDLFDIQKGKVTLTRKYISEVGCREKLNPKKIASKVHREFIEEYGEEDCNEL